MKLPHPEITTLPNVDLNVLSRSYSMATRHEIPQLWEAFDALQSHTGKEAGRTLYGVSSLMQEDGGFTYSVGFEADSALPTAPFRRLALPSGRYAVFHLAGPYAAIPQVFDAIFGEWFPTAQWAQREGAVFERYPAHTGTGQPGYEIWVPVAVKP